MLGPMILKVDMSILNTHGPYISPSKPKLKPFQILHPPPPQPPNTK